MFMDGFTVVVREYVIEKHPVLCVGIFLFLLITFSIIFFKRETQNKAMAFAGTILILCGLFIGISYEIPGAWIAKPSDDENQPPSLKDDIVLCSSFTISEIKIPPQYRGGYVYRQEKVR